MADFFTADTHFNHVNIREYCHRPGDSVEEMNEIMIARWNARVCPNDTVYHLGDFAMGHKVMWPEIRRRLNGRIVLMRGNHDAEGAIQRALLPSDEIHHEYVYTNSKRTIRVHLAHVPPNTPLYVQDERSFVRPTALFVPGMPSFCGHVHDAWITRGVMINVGVDVRDYEPKRLDELI